MPVPGPRLRRPGAQTSGPLDKAVAATDAAANVTARAQRLLDLCAQLGVGHRMGSGISGTHLFAGGVRTLASLTRRVQQRAAGTPKQEQVPGQRGKPRTRRRSPPGRACRH